MRQSLGSVNDTGAADEWALSFSSQLVRMLLTYYLIAINIDALHIFFQNLLLVVGKQVGKAGLKDTQVMALLIEARKTLRRYAQPSWTQKFPHLLVENQDIQSAQGSTHPSPQSPIAPSPITAPFTQSPLDAQTVVCLFFTYTFSLLMSSSLETWPCDTLTHLSAPTANSAR
jgi:hypothetical protein